MEYQTEQNVVACNWFHEALNAQVKIRVAEELWLAYKSLLGLSRYGSPPKYRPAWKAAAREVERLIKRKYGK